MQINSYRTYSHSELKKLLAKGKNSLQNSYKHNKIKNNHTNENIDQQKQLNQIIRSNELSIMQLRNQNMKKQIQLKQKVQSIKDLNKQIEVFRKQKQHFCKIKIKFQNQRKQFIEKTSILQENVSQLKYRLQAFQQPRDRYDTCIRQLDQLKMNIEEKQDASKQRDFYKYFFQEVKQMALSPFYSPIQLQTSLRSLFVGIQQKLSKSK